MNPEDALDLVGMKTLADRFPSQLSGGEQQRVSIARAIAKRPDILLCDEPTGALDYETGRKVLEAIEKIHNELGTLVVIITHNAAIAGMADRVIRIEDGRIGEIRRQPSRLPLDEIRW
jgi:putative ABC transport system ATP-binding protein